jgi:hypothetical protein
MRVEIGSIRSMDSDTNPVTSVQGCQGKWDRFPKNYLRCFLHSHGGTGCGSAYKPFFASRAFFSSLSNSLFPRAYF